MFLVSSMAIPRAHDSGDVSETYTWTGSRPQAISHDQHALAARQSQQLYAVELDCAAVDGRCHHEDAAVTGHTSFPIGLQDSLRAGILSNAHQLS